MGTDDACLDYLEWLRWPEGFVCDSCGHAGGWWLGDGRIECGGCSRRTSVTSGTIFDRTRTPLTVWFTVIWLFATAKDGVSAQRLQRTLEFGSYQTAWAMLHRLRSVLVRPGRERLSGRVEVDETFIGGQEPGLRGGRQRGKKTLVVVAVEVHEPKGFGRCRMRIIPDASADSLHPFVQEHIESGTTVITDGWQGYAGLERLGYTRERQPARRTPGGRRPPWAAAGRASDRVVGEALAAQHPPRLSRRGTSAGLPRGVRVPIQPPQIAEPRSRLLSPPRARREARSRALRRHCDRRATSQDDAVSTAGTRSPTRPRTATPRPAVASR